MIKLPCSWIPTARRCRELAKNSPDDALRIVAKHLDFPMDDAETVDFLRQAFAAADKEIHAHELRERLSKLENKA